MTGYIYTHRPTPYGQKISGYGIPTNADNGGEDKIMKKTTKTNAKASTFETLLVTFAAEADRPNNNNYTKALTDLATAVAYSVLKKCIDKSGNDTLIQVRRSIAHDLNTLDRIAYANDHAYTTAYNADGDYTRTVNDSECANALTTLCAECFGDGLDLVHDAVCAILVEVDKQRQRDPNTPIDLERPYTVRRLKRKVWIKTANSVDGWETVSTTPIQEVYRAVRRAIQQSQAVQSDPRNGYTYLADLATDPNSDATDTIYRRLHKYADLGGYETDYNRAMTVYTVDTQTVDDYNGIVERLNLTAKQAKILQLRQSGYGEKAIGTYLGVSKQAVQCAIKQIQKKAIAIGLTPPTPPTK